MLTKEEATRQVLSIVNRMALLHYSYERRSSGSWGEEGKELTRRAIDFYASGWASRSGRRPWPGVWPALLKIIRKICRFSLEHGKERRRRRTAPPDSRCNLAKAWERFGDPALGVLTAIWIKPNTRPTTRNSNAFMPRIRSTATLLRVGDSHKRRSGVPSKRLNAEIVGNFGFRNSSFF